MYTFYLFAVSFFGLLLFYTGATEGFSNLATVLAGDGCSWGVYATISGFSMALPAGIVWLLHWRTLAAKRGTHGKGEHNLTYFYLLFAAGLLVIGMVSHARGTVDALANLALGLGSGQLAYAGGALINTLISVGLWLFHMRAFKEESEYGKKLAAKKSKS